MRHEDPHPTREELLRAIDGELSDRRTIEVRAHVSSCWECRTEMYDIEAAIAGFVHARRDSLDPRLPPVEGSRALLKARLAAAGAPQTPAWDRSLLYAVAVLILVAAVIVIARVPLHHAGKTLSELEAPAVALTPGLVREVSWEEVCSANSSTAAPVVPASLRDKVFQEYGLPNAEPQAFEVDYLITPELGGAADIRNLWPQSYSSPVWNAHVKDSLEERLHQMVCAGQVDLATAQHDLATDWISAYKKYFHSDRPLQN